ncbi:MAG: undecaprenyl-diphosphate phosphatase [gamma proteobacterium symbiont of Bathyaustriella thionipta]|nr:undecaprenyl-diphosphate phosphatase [gamma proteobacterium symbiont of Bathyaustriella thionipta]MCU7949766.1 undecaprenyl-diphosphate phosphatase [gamma proteobacterium symbiont of Bathyaustriella thionipta]MCU7953007.1 undecaprenyl-diphosphate phosphatase [gamma proteobacterium symbiont of Bathyaustriella thionipta]MCU7956351.1 undecaprenyl-diphosphate phosphatase [gamma proteobacterium symbiont of Bathyaustriella thionipta]MCU7966466.1 undecaprenyl-diphosphate phosphatase [gamma proteoba
MDVIHSILLGLIEGVTEFLPVSSTGHLIIISDWLGLPQSDSNMAFEIIIQLAAILAVISNYSNKFTLEHRFLWYKVLIAFIPIGIFGLLFHQSIKSLFSVEIVASMFIVGGVIFLIVEKKLKNQSFIVTKVEEISYKQAGIIGIAQIFALIPGTSRAGSTIIGALLVGVNREASAEFSFLLALPVMVAASSLDLFKHYQDFSGTSALPLIIGFLTAYISAHFTMKWLVFLLNKFTFNAFGIYRIIFGILLLVLYY